MSETCFVYFWFLVLFPILRVLPKPTIKTKNAKLLPTPLKKNANILPKPTQNKKAKFVGQLSVFCRFLLCFAVFVCRCFAVVFCFAFAFFYRWFFCRALPFFRFLPFVRRRFCRVCLPFPLPCVCSLFAVFLAVVLPLFALFFVVVSCCCSCCSCQTTSFGSKSSSFMLVGIGRPFERGRYRKLCQTNQACGTCARARRTVGYVSNMLHDCRVTG